VDTSSPFSDYLDRLSRYWLGYYSWRGLSQNPFTGPESKGSSTRSGRTSTSGRQCPWQWGEYREKWWP
jgi:hypothetical protein